MNAPTETVIGCVPIDAPPIDGVPFTPYKGSVQLPCSVCGRTCWVGPESLKLHKLGVVLMCLLCVVKTTGAMPTIVKLTDKKMGE